MADVLVSEVLIKIVLSVTTSTIFFMWHRKGLFVFSLGVLPSYLIIYSFIGERESLYRKSPELHGSF
jgi:hypothetical protein